MPALNEGESLPKWGEGERGFNSPPAPAIEMPRYKCHKEVHALKIVRAYPLHRISDGAVTHYDLCFEEPGYAPIQVTAEWGRRTDSALVGGYYVVYADGYTAWSPAKAFEEGYTRVSP